MDGHRPTLVDWSCRLYARLLTMLPRSFQQEYAPALRQTFRDLSLEAWRAHGARGLAGVWLQALPDLAAGAAEEWQLTLAEGDRMERVAVRTGLMLVLVVCAVALAVLVTPHEARAVVALLAAAGVMAVAVAGWRSRHWQAAAAGGADSSLTPTPAGDERAAWPRQMLLGLELVFLTLFVYVFRFVFPTVPSSAAAHHLAPLLDDIWRTRGFNYFQVGMIILGAYVTVTVLGTRGGSARPWLIIGLLAGGLGGLTAAALTPTAPLGTQLLTMLAAAALAGLLAGGRTGQVEAGALGGFWCGLAAALVWASASLVVDLTLAGPLAGTAWASSHACQGLAGNELTLCAAAYDVSTWGKMLMGLPILSGGLGVIGGLLGAALSGARRPATARWGQALLAPVLFCGFLVILYAAGAIGLL